MARMRVRVRVRVPSSFDAMKTSALGAKCVATGNPAWSVAGDASATGQNLCAVSDGLPQDVVVAELAREPHALVELVDGEGAGGVEATSCCGRRREWRRRRDGSFMRLAEVTHAVSDEGSIRVF